MKQNNHLVKRGRWCWFLHWIMKKWVWELNPSSYCLDCGYPKDELFGEFKVKCGCYVTDGEPHPKVQLVCDEHVGMEIYGDYDGSVEKLCDYLMTFRRHSNG